LTAPDRRRAEPGVSPGDQGARAREIRPELSARPARHVARLRGRAGGSWDPRRRRAQSRRGAARGRRRPARLVGWL